mmetsp:Transcript_39733/g.68115  ORF Transcript_39733/g.68115 Transcript_39733/m.68115 type:complete len:248 (-) Transcript_39733:17-760(-)
MTSEAEQHRSSLNGFTPIFKDPNCPINCHPVEHYQSLVESGEHGSVKVVHFVRHGRGFHNEKAEGIGCQCNVHPPQIPCPYICDEILDAQLTDIGKQEAEKFNGFMRENDITVEHIITSPLSRAIQTWSIGMNLPKYQHLEVLCLPELREQYGTHTCDKRRTRSWLEETYPGVNFSKLSEHDELFTDERETREHLGSRILQFLKYVEEHPTTHIAVFTHSSFLFTMSGEWFETGQLRTMVVTFPKKQ